MGRVTRATCSDKRPARPPTKHFKGLLEEAYPDHTYLIKHKLKDYDIMKSFITSRSPTWGTRLDDDPGRSYTMPFPRANAIMTVCEGCPPLGAVTCLS
jgi:hypothetical protein